MAGTDFYDSDIPENDGDSSIEEDSALGLLVLREGGEWTTYDLTIDGTNFPAGTYSISADWYFEKERDVKYGGYDNGFLDWIVDGRLQSRTRFYSLDPEVQQTPKSSSDIGKVYLDEGNHVLKIKNSSFLPMMLGTIKLTYLKEEKDLDALKIYPANVTMTVKADKSGVAGVQDEDYYDQAEKPLTATNVLEYLDTFADYSGTDAYGAYGKVLVQHRTAPGDWARFGISDFPPGRYNVKFMRASRGNSKTNIMLDGETVLKEVVNELTDANTYVYAEDSLGNIEILENSQYLKVRQNGVGIHIKYLTLTEVGYDVSFEGTNAIITGESRFFSDSDYLFSVKTNTGAELDDVYAIAKTDGGEIPVNDLGNGNYSISKENIRDSFTIYANASMELSDAYKGKMDFLVDGNNLFTRTSHDESYDLVQKFFGLKEQSLDENEPFDFGESGLVLKAEDIDSTYSISLANGGDEAAPFKFNGSYIGANHGYSKGVLVNSTAHGKTYADIGSLWEDADGYKWSLLKVPNENQLLFLSENTNKNSLTNYKVRGDISGDTLTYVSHGKNTGDITIESRDKNQQIYSANKYVYKKVYAVKGGIRVEAEDGVLTNCDYVDFEEKYYIMNPVMIGATLRENRPEGGYTEPQSMAIGQPLVECVLTYRIMPDGTVLTMFEHKILEDITFDYYGALQYRFNKFLNFESGLYRYIPKSKAFTLSFESGDMTLDFTEPINMTTLEYPPGAEYLMGSDAWENADIVPDRQVDYAYDETNDNIAVSFSSGFLPIYDTEPSVRKTKTSAATYVYNTKKTYPYFVDALAFSETGTTKQIIKGVAYKKYGSADQKDITYYTIPYEGKTYVYVDCHEIAERQIQLSDILVPGADFAQIEKSDNVVYSVANDVLNVEMTEGIYGYLVLCIDNPEFEAEVVSVNATQGVANLSFKNNSSETKTSTLLIASYLNGRLKEIKPVTITIGPGVQYFFSENFVPNSFDKIKAFVWEDLAGMSPISRNGSGEVIPD